MSLPSPEQTREILHTGRGWSTRLSERCGGKSEAAAALWALVHTMPLPGDQEESAWWWMAHHSTPTAGDLIALLKHDIQHSRTAEARWTSWGCTDWLRSLCPMVEALGGDAAVLVSAREALPQFSRELLEFALAAAGHLPPRELGLEMFATWIASGGSDRGWIFGVLPRVFGGKPWAGAVWAALRERTYISNYGSLYPIVSHLDDEEVVALARDLTWEPGKTAAMLATAGPRTISALHQQLRADPPLKVALTWLIMLQRLGGDLSAYASLIESIAEDPNLARMDAVPVIEALPIETRARLAQSTPFLRWPLVAAAPTPAVLRTAIETIVSLPRSPGPDALRAIGRAFHHIGAAAKGALLAALPGKVHRGLLLRLLWPHLDADALSVLVAMLGDRSADIREKAADALGQLPPEIVRPALVEALSSRKQKLGAARALAMRPALVEGIREAVSARLAREKHPDVRQALSAALHPPPTPAPLRRLFALIESITPAQRPDLERALYGTPQEDWLNVYNRMSRGHRAHGEVLFALAVERIVWRSQRLLPSRDEWYLSTFHRRVDPELVAWAGALILMWIPVESNATPSGLTSAPSEPIQAAFTWLMTHHDPPGRRRIFESMVRGRIRAGEAYLRGLRASDSKTRRACQDGLRLELAPHVPALIALLSHPTATVREAAAVLLEGVEGAQAPLRAALAKERNRQAREAMEDALG